MGADNTRRGVFDVKDTTMALAQRQNAFFNKTKKVDAAMSDALRRGEDEEDAGDKKGKARTLLVSATDASNLSLYGTVALTRVPSPEQLAQAMGMYWEEGLAYAERVKQE